MSRNQSTITLASGHRLHIRPLRRGEDGTVRELFARLSLPTRYLRFFLPLPVLSDSLLRMIGAGDEPGRIALVAETDDIRPQVVALGNVAPADDGRGEVGLVVADAWQRQGIGSAVAGRLLHDADGAGYRGFVVYSLLGNPAVRPLLARVAWCPPGRTTVCRRPRLFGVGQSRRRPASGVRIGPRERTKEC